MWYRIGTVSVTNNSPTVTGAGTDFVANVRAGDAFRGPDGAWYEVINAASASSMSITPNYQGSSTSGAAYAVAPMQGYVKTSADMLRQFVTEYGDQLENLGTLAGQDAANVTVGNFHVTGAMDSLGDVSFTGTGKRFSADFSNATAANRFSFVSSVANGATNFGLLPNGTSRVGNMSVYNTASTVNSANVRLGVSATEAVLASEVTGTGTAVPLKLYTGGVARVTVLATGNVGINQAAPACALDVTGAIRATVDIRAMQVLGQSTGSTTPSVYGGQFYVEAAANNHPAIGFHSNGIYGGVIKLAADGFNFMGSGGASWTDLIASSIKAKAAVTVDAAVGQASIFLAQAGTTNGRIYAGGGAGTDINIESGRFITVNPATAFKVNFASVEKLTVASSGFTGINNASPAYQLDVTGTTRATALRIENPTAVVTLKATGATATTMTNFTSYQDSTGAEVAWAGFGTSDGEMGFNNSSRIIRFRSPVVCNSTAVHNAKITADFGVGTTPTYNTGQMLLRNGATGGGVVLGFDVAAVSAAALAHRPGGDGLEVHGYTWGVFADFKARQFTATRGIVVGNSMQAEANVIDWFERGTFTPTAVGATTPGAPTSYAQQIGRFQRVGNTVHARIDLAYTGHTGIGGMRITGLPYASLSTLQVPVAVSADGVAVTAAYALQGFVYGGTAYVILVQRSPAGGVSEINIPVNLGRLSITVSYEV